MAVPSPYIPGCPNQSHTWKLVNILYSMKTWIGYVSHSAGEFSASFKIYSPVYTQVCVRLPFVLLKGTIKWNKTMGLLRVLVVPYLPALITLFLSVSLMSPSTF